MQKQNTGRHIAKRATAIALSAMTIAGATAALGIAPEYSPVAMTVSAATTMPVISQYTISDGTTSKMATSMTVRPGASVTISLQATGGSGSYSYRFDLIDPNGKTSTSKPSTGRCSFTTSSKVEGKYTVKATVTDDAGKKATKNFTITGSFGKLSNKSSISMTTATVNNTRTPVITMTGTGGKGPYKYIIRQSYDNPDTYETIKTQTVNDGKITDKYDFALPKYTKPGTYYYQIELTDSLGGTSSVTKKVTVADDVAKVSVGLSLSPTAKPGDKDKSKLTVYAIGGHPTYTYNVYRTELGSNGKPVKDSITGEYIYKKISTKTKVAADNKNGAKVDFYLQTENNKLSVGEYKIKVEIIDSTGVKSSRETSFNVKWDVFHNDSNISLGGVIEPKVVILAEDTVASVKQNASTPEKPVSYATIKAKASGGSGDSSNYEYSYFVCDKEKISEYKNLKPTELGRLASDEKAKAEKDSKYHPTIKIFKKNNSTDVKTVNNVKINIGQRYMFFTEKADLNREYALLVVANDKAAKKYSTIVKEFKVSYGDLSVNALAYGTVAPAINGSNRIVIGFDIDSSVIPSDWAYMAMSATGGKPGYKIKSISATYRGANETADKATPVTVELAKADIKNDKGTKTFIKKGQYYIKPDTSKLYDNGVYTITVVVQDALGNESREIVKTVKSSVPSVTGELSMSSSKVTPKTYLVFDDKNLDPARSVIVTTTNVKGGYEQYDVSYELFDSAGKSVSLATAKNDKLSNGDESTLVHKDKMYVSGLPAGNYKLKVSIADKNIKDNAEKYKAANGKDYKPFVIEKTIKVEYESFSASLRVTSDTKSTNMNKVGYIIVNDGPTNVVTSKPADRSLQPVVSGGSGQYSYSYKITRPDGKTVKPYEAKENSLQIKAKDANGDAEYADKGTKYFYINNTGVYKVTLTVKDVKTNEVKTAYMSFVAKMPDITFSSSSVKVGANAAKTLNVGGSATAKLSENHKLTIQLANFSGGNYKYCNYEWYVRKEGSGDYTKLTWSNKNEDRYYTDKKELKSSFGSSDIKSMTFTYTPATTGKYHFYVGLCDTDGHGAGKNDSLALKPPYEMFTVTVNK